MSSSASSTSSSRPGIVAGSNQKVKKQKAEFEKGLMELQSHQVPSTTSNLWYSNTIHFLLFLFILFILFILLFSNHHD